MLVIILTPLSLHCNLTPTVKCVNYDHFWCMGNYMYICLKTEMDWPTNLRIFSCFKLNELGTICISIYWI